MSKESNTEPMVGMPASMPPDAPPSLELIREQKNLLEAQERALAAQERVNRSALELMQADPQVQAGQLQVAQAKEMEPAQLKFQRKQIEFLAKQQENLQTTSDILFKQTKGAALMFYASFWLGFALVVMSVISYLFIRRDPNDLLTVAFFGVGALAMLSFFLRDPAEKIQQTAGKLVQIQAAMRYHTAEIGGWDAYITKKLSSNEPLTHEELAMALQSIREGTQTIMRQIDESLDDKKANKD